MSYSRPLWLPPLISCSGEWNTTLERLYRVFERDFIESKPTFLGKRLWWDRRILPGETFQEGFWHLISRTDPTTGVRNPDFRRAERLCWCRPFLEHAEDPALTLWESEEGRKGIRTYVWLEPEDYVVVLEQRARDVAFLITAYSVDGESTRRKLSRSHANRRKMQSPP